MCAFIYLRERGRERPRDMKMYGGVSPPRPGKRPEPPASKPSVSKATDEELMHWG